MEIFWEARDASGGEIEVELRKINDSLFQLALVSGFFRGYPNINLSRKDLKDLHDAIEHLMGWRKNDGSLPPPEEGSQRTP